MDTREEWTRSSGFTETTVVSVLIALTWSEFMSRPFYFPPQQMYSSVCPRWMKVYLAESCFNTCWCSRDACVHLMTCYWRGSSRESSRLRRLWQPAHRLGVSEWKGKPPDSRDTVCPLCALFWLGPSRCLQFVQVAECKGHTGPVCAVDAIYVEDSEILVASSASDSTVRLWLCNQAVGGNEHKSNDWNKLVSGTLWLLWCNTLLPW